MLRTGRRVLVLSVALVVPMALACTGACSRPRATPEKKLELRFGSAARSAGQLYWDRINRGLSVEDATKEATTSLTGSLSGDHFVKHEVLVMRRQTEAGDSNDPSPTDIGFAVVAEFPHRKLVHLVDHTGHVTVWAGHEL